MALKHKLTKVEYDALTDAMKALYKADGDSFLLDTEGVDDVGELRRAKERETAEAKKQRERADKAEKEAQDARDAISREKGDVSALDKSWQKKFDEGIAAEKEKSKLLGKQLNNALIDTRATAIAAELAGDAAELLLPTLKQRMQLEIDGENVIVRVLDKDGRKSALTVDELKKEVAEDKRFAKIVIASKASGSGAAGGNRQPNGGAGSGGQGGKKFHELNSQERTEWYKRDPEGFNQASAASQKEQREALVHRPLARATA